MAHLIGAAKADLLKCTAPQDPIEGPAKKNPLYGLATAGAAATTGEHIQPADVRLDALPSITHGYFEGRTDDHLL